MPDVPLGGGGVGSVIDVIVDIHNARKGPPSGVPEQPGYRGPGDVIYDQRQAPTPTEDVVASGILDTPYSPYTPQAPYEPPVLVNEPPPITNTEPPIAGEVISPPAAGAPHDYEGYYDPYTEPAPVYNSGVTVEGEYSNVPDVQTGIDRRSPPPRETADDVLARIGGSIVGRVIGRVIGVASGPIGTVIQEILTPNELPPEPDVRGLPGVFGAAPEIPSTPRAPAPRAPPAASRPPRPQLPPVPRPPTVSVPTPPRPDTWNLPSSNPPSLPRSTPLPSPIVPETISLPGTTAPQPATSSQPAPSSSSPPASSQPPSPRWQFDPLPPWLADLQRSRSPSTSAPIAAPRSPTITSPAVSTPSPVTTTSTSTLPSTQTLTGSSAPPLTPLKPAAVESPPAGDYCETPQQTKQRRQQKREQCERFITITIPKHKRRVCASEAGKYIGKKLGKAIGRGVGRVLRGKSFVAPESKRKSARRKEESPVRLGRRGRSVELPGGIGVELPKQLRPNLRIPKLPGAHRP